MEFDYSDCKTPQDFAARDGFYSVQPGMRQVMRVTYRDPKTKMLTRSNDIYWRSREMAAGISSDKYKNLEVRDRRIDPDHYIYKTDDGRAA